MYDRFIAIDGLHNLRDFGATASVHGGMIRPGVLYRAANFSTLSDQGRAELSALNLAVLVDLRRASERAQMPNAVDGLGIATIASDLAETGTDQLAPHLQFLKDGAVTAETARGHMLDAYRRFLTFPQHRETFAGAFAHLAQDARPMAVHCAAGKDRTGVLCALILKVLGADEDHIHADYLATNYQPGLEERIVMYAGMVSEQFGRPLEPEALRPMVGVDLDYLTAAFDEMSRSFGGWQGYLAWLGIDEPIQQAVRARLIVEEGAP